MPRRAQDALARHADLIFAKLSDIGPAPSRSAAGDTPLSYYISGIMRNSMRLTGTHIVALSAAATRSFIRPGDRRVMCAAMGSFSQYQPASGWSKPD
jgi:hypothetical protein